MKVVQPDTILKIPQTPSWNQGVKKKGKRSPKVKMVQNSIICILSNKCARISYAVSGIKRSISFILFLFVFRHACTGRTIIERPAVSTIYSVGGC